MKVRDAKKRLNDLECLVDNLKKYLEYRKIDTREALELEADEADLTIPLTTMLKIATDEIATMAGKYERAIEDAEITELTMR